jgi:hypothetical protein
VNAEFVYPEQIDRHLNWPLGTAARLARRRQLPHYLLPDGSIRLRKDEVEALVQRVPLWEQQEPVLPALRSGVVIDPEGVEAVDQ